jgi:hypothetical protein
MKSELPTFETFVIVRGMQGVRLTLKAVTLELAAKLKVIVLTGLVVLSTEVVEPSAAAKYSVAPEGAASVLRVPTKPSGRVMVSLS